MATSVTTAGRSVAEPCPQPRQNWFRRMLAVQASWSGALDRLLPASFQTDGNREFVDLLIPQYLRPAARVYEVGGGKNPVVDREKKRHLGLEIIGIDIDPAQLAEAPEGFYDRTICANITDYRGTADGDLVICQALLEHVSDTSSAIESIASLLKPGGRALIFVPSRNAVYARLNLILPEVLKRRLLFAIYPAMSRDHGFPAYYDGCTPQEIERKATRYRLFTERRLLYFRSDYFRFCFPLHLAWRCWVALFRAVAGARAAETFSFVFSKTI